MDAFRQQLKYTVRKLTRAPFFSGVAVLTLAVGIGSNAAIFSVVDAVLLEPLPFPEPDRLVGVWHVAPGLGFDHDSPVNQSPALHYTYAAEARAFASVGMWDNGQVSVTGLGEPERIDAMFLTHQTLPLLGVLPAMGRAFSAEDDTPGTPETVILSHGYWERRFGGDPGVLGQTILINGLSREVIGVMPRGTRFLRFDPDVYMPFRFDEATLFVGNFSYQAVGRLAEGQTTESANADIDRMIPIAIERYPGAVTMGMAREVGLGASVHSLKRDVVGDIGSVLWVLLGTVGIVLLIACANVANLFIVRAEGRQREIAVRAALGAGRRQVTVQLLLESAVLACVGGAAGLALAYGGIRLLVALGPDTLPRLHEVGLDPSVLGFTGGVTLFAALLFGLLPALKFGRISFVSALKEGGRGGSSGKERHVARNVLVVAQMALALVLLTGSGLMVRSFMALQAVDPGFTAPEEMLTFRLTIPGAEVEDAVEAALAHEQILRAIQAIPGVSGAAISSSVTMDGWDSNDPVEIEDDPVQGDEIPPLRRFKWIGGGYHETMGNPVLAGRSITWGDVQDRTMVAVITEDFAREYWGSAGAAIGERIRVYGGELGATEWREVVGVVGDIHDDGVSRDPVSAVYWPYVTESFYNEGVTTQRSMAYAVRARNAQPSDLLPQIREAVWSVNPNLPLARVRTLSEIVTESMARTSFTLVMLATAAGVALFLGIVGIYGVISYIVSERTREIGVRMAMGAERGDIGRMVLRQASALALGGVVLGLVAAAGLTRLMSALLFGVSPMDPATFGTVAGALALVALVASWIPARRAASVDPVVALRFE